MNKLQALESLRDYLNGRITPAWQAHLDKITKRQVINTLLSQFHLKGEGEQDLLDSLITYVEADLKQASLEVAERLIAKLETNPR